MRSNSRRILPALVVSVTLATGIVIGSLLSRGVRAAKMSAGVSDARPLTVASPTELSNSFAKIAEMVEPAVVNINTESTVHVTRRRFRAPEDSPFDDFFDRFFQFGNPDGPPGDFRQQSLGSGVILDKSGYILTNFHVITQGGEDKLVDRINVYLHGDEGTKYKAKIIGTDKSTDLAVIKIEAGRPLSTTPLGDSESMRVGDWVLAVGSPFGLESTVTAGIVSAKGREIEGGPEGQFKRFLQTDAAINPGNSGGPLVNLAGQVIGINTAIATRRGSYDGVGFAIPSNTARKVYNAIVTTGSVRRGAIGVTFRNDKNAALLRSFGAEHGVVVQSVEAGSPAERAGLARGDVVITVNGKPIMNGDDLVAIVSDSDIGRKLKIEYLRDRKAMSTEVEVGDRNKIAGDLRRGEDLEGTEEPGEEAGGPLGVAVRNLTRDQAQELADELHLGSHPQGVLVTEVKPGSFASDLGLVRGDVILSFNHKTVSSVEEFNRLLAQIKSGSDVLLLIARQTPQRKFTTLFLAERLP